MCGIVGTSWSKKAREFIIGGLEKLEYRGYDSAGIYYLDKDNKSNLIRTIERVKKLKDIMLELKLQGVSMLVSTHLLSSVEDLWDRIVIMDKGNIVLSKTKKELETPPHNGV